jgi:hypothetical protein
MFPFAHTNGEVVSAPILWEGVAGYWDGPMERGQRQDIRLWHTADIRRQLTQKGRLTLFPFYDYIPIA